MHALLGIDLGTTGVKAALFAVENGDMVSSAFVDYPLLHPQPGWAEQHPADWWQATVVALRSYLAQAALSDVRPIDVLGVGLSVQMHGVVLLDAQQVLRPCIIWADRRSEAQCRWITGRVGAKRLSELVSKRCASWNAPNPSSSSARSTSKHTRSTVRSIPPSNRSSVDHLKKGGLRANRSTKTA
jgi:xylulokinase